MQTWHTTYLGLKDIPRELSGFELQAFFTYSRAESAVINARHGTTHKLGLALHIGFLRLSGRSLKSIRMIPAGTGQAARGDASGGRRLESAGQHRYGLEHHADAGCGQPLGQSASGDRVRHHGKDSAYAPQRHKFTGCIPVSGGALCRRPDAFDGACDTCSGWLKPTTD